MKANPNYRPGNLIIGGGGRGVRKASAKYGIGEWETLREHGNPVGECVIRKRQPDAEEKEEEKEEEREKRTEETAERKNGRAISA